MMPNEANFDSIESMDQESVNCLAQMAAQEKVFLNRIPDVKFVLVILSARGMAFDLEALRQKITLAYPEAAVFFQTTEGKSVGLETPSHVDLVVDFTGPGQRQSLCYAKKLRKMGKFVVGRNAGFFRKRIYDRIFDEKIEAAEVPREMLQRERFVQKKVMNLAGVAFVQTSETPPDRGKTIALELPGMLKL